MDEAPIRVAIPAEARYVRIVRMVASASAASVGLGLDRLDDLALAIDEACGALLHVPGTSSLQCSISAVGPGIRVRVDGRDAVAPTWPPPDWQDSLEAIVLFSVAEDVTASTEEGVPAIAFDMSA